MAHSADYAPLAVRAASVTPDGPFYLRRSIIDTLEDDGPAWKFEDSKLIESCIENPTSVFRGLNRKGLADGLCFVSKPAALSDGTTPPQGAVFRTFVELEWGYIVFDWDWHLEGKTPGLPKCWDNDFGEQIWSPP